MIATDRGTRFRKIAPYPLRFRAAFTAANLKKREGYRGRVTGGGSDGEPHREGRTGSPLLNISLLFGSGYYI